MLGLIATTVGRPSRHKYRAWTSLTWCWGQSVIMVEGATQASGSAFDHRNFSSLCSRSWLTAGRPWRHVEKLCSWGRPRFDWRSNWILAFTGHLPCAIAIIAGVAIGLADELGRLDSR